MTHCSLPPHRVYDCVQPLLPGAILPTSQLYSLSKPEQESMKKYIIWPSSSPLGFLFVEKTDKTRDHALTSMGYTKINTCCFFCPQVVKGGHYVQPSVMHIIWWGLRKGTEGGVDGLHLDQFKYLVMPFALTNVPVVFQALINNILQHFMNCLFIRLTSWFSPGPPKNMDLMLRQVLQCLFEYKRFV